MTENKRLEELGNRLVAGDSSVIDELVRHGAREQLRRGLESEYPLTREEALTGLAQIRDPRDLPLMLERMGDHYMEDAAQLCVQDYGELAVEPLLDRLRAGTENILCTIEALGVIGDRRAVAPLEETAEQHPNELARQWAREALERIERGGGDA